MIADTTRNRNGAAARTDASRRQRGLSLTSSFTLVALLSASCAILVLTSVFVRRTGAEAYEKYRDRGGEKGFWSWYVRDLCGVPVPGLEPEGDEPSVRAKASAAAESRRKAELARQRARMEAVERMQRAEHEMALEEERRLAQRLKRADKRDRRRKADRRGGRSGKFVKTGAKSSYVAGNGKTPYRVSGIRGIDFGSTDNAPPEGARPVMSVSYDSDGNLKFNSLRWRENKRLTEPVYGFDKALLSHTFETEQLSSVVFNKSFPFTEEGFRQATEFYRAMSAEASADLGFEAVDVDCTGNAKSATICEFRNGDGETSIRGAISAWSDKSLTVTFSVSDKAYSKDLSAQSRAAYDAGVADQVNAKVEVNRGDYSDRMERIEAFDIHPLRDQPSTR